MSLLKDNNSLSNDNNHMNNLSDSNEKINDNTNQIIDMHEILPSSMESNSHDDVSEEDVSEEDDPIKTEYTPHRIKESFCKIKPHETLITLDKDTKDYYCENEYSICQTFSIAPLEIGYGLTIGNALRRILLSQLSGVAAYGVRISEMRHEFDSVDGVAEDMTNINLNIKGIIFKPKNHTEIISSKISCDIKGPITVTADILELPKNIEIINKKHVICHINSDRRLAIDIFIKSGAGYTVAEDHDNKNDEIIPIDSLFAPIIKVTFKVEPVYGEKKGLEKLLMTIETNGSIDPQLALAKAARILKEKLSIFDILGNSKIAMDIVSDTSSTEVTIPKILYTKISDTHELGNRAITCLKNNGMVYLGDLIQQKENRILKLKNLGQITFKKIKSWITNIQDPYNEDLKLRFGMDIPGWLQ